MLVPAAINDVIFRGNPIFGPNHVTKPMPVQIDKATTGTPAAPNETISKALSFAPTHMMPPRRIVVVENFKPFAKTSGNCTPGMLRNPIPNRMEMGMPETGLLAPDTP